jgi:thioredoxin 2
MSWHSTTTTYIIKCTSCGTANRIPSDKEGIKGQCGNCKAVLPQLYCHPQQLNDRTFDSFINSYPGPVLAEFWAPT